MEVRIKIRLPLRKMIHYLQPLLVNGSLKVGRDDWQTKLESFSEMTSDETTFYLTNTLVAFENEKEVFRNTWKKEVPRDFN